MQYGQVLRHLLEACPSYDADVSMSEMTDSTADFYACLSGLAAHLIELHRLGQVEKLRSAFRGVESVFETSDEWMTWKVYYGFLERTSAGFRRGPCGSALVLSSSEVSN